MIFYWLGQVKEIENDPYVKEVSVAQRNCRFPSENYLQSYQQYSYSACVVDCRAQAQLRFCNCTHHFMPKIGERELNFGSPNFSALTLPTHYSKLSSALYSLTYPHVPAAQLPSSIYFVLVELFTHCDLKVYIVAPFLFLKKNSLSVLQP